MHEELIGRIKCHLAAKGIAIFPPAPEELLSKTEISLGFEIPPLLRSVYGEVSNGGFGPGYGLIGVAGGRATNLGTLVDEYHGIIRGAEYLGINWKPGLLPFCEWGCNVFSCVDCTATHYPVVQSEVCKTFTTSYTIEDFFRMWLDDMDLFGSSSSPRRTVPIINPFTERISRATGRDGASDLDSGRDPC